MGGEKAVAFWEKNTNFLLETSNIRTAKLIITFLLIILTLIYIFLFTYTYKKDI